MRLIEKLEAKRDAAHAEYVKWQGMIDTLQADPEFASITHFGATRAMKTAHALNGNGNGNGASAAPESKRGTGFDHVAASKKGWTEERKKAYSERMKGNNIWTLTEKMKAKRKHKLSPAARKAISDRLKKLHKDPKWQAKRLKNLRKSLKTKKAARVAAQAAVSE